MEMQKPKGIRVGLGEGEEPEGPRPGELFHKPRLGEGLWLRTKVSGWERGKMWALATAELFTNSHQVLTVGPALPSALWLLYTPQPRGHLG